MPGLAVRHMAPARACPRDEWQEKMVTSSHIAPIRFRSTLSLSSGAPHPPTTTTQQHVGVNSQRAASTSCSSHPPLLPSCDELHSHFFWVLVQSAAPRTHPWGSFWVLVCHNAATSSVCVSVSVGKFFIIFFWKVEGVPQLEMQ